MRAQHTFDVPDFGAAKDPSDPTRAGDVTRRAFSYLMVGAAGKKTTNKNKNKNKNKMLVSIFFCLSLVFLSFQALPTLRLPRWLFETLSTR